MIETAHKNRPMRFPLKVPIHYRKSGRLNWMDGRTVNISRTGVFFHTDEYLKADLKLEIRISLPRELTLSCQGTVVRAETGISAGSKTGMAIKINHCHLLRPEKAKVLFG